MAFDVADLLGNLFGNGPAAVPVPEAALVPEAADPLAATLFADWVLRPDFLGRMGWEAPDLPEWQRWWVRGDFDDLPVVPEGFRFGELQEPARHDCAGCVPAGRADTLDVPALRPLQGRLQGFGGA